MQRSFSSGSDDRDWLGYEIAQGGYGCKKGKSLLKSSSENCPGPKKCSTCRNSEPRPCVAATLQHEPFHPHSSPRPCIARYLAPPPTLPEEVTHRDSHSQLHPPWTRRRPQPLLPPYRWPGDRELTDNSELLEWLFSSIGRVEARTFQSYRAPPDSPLYISLSNRYTHGRVFPLTPHNSHSC